ncbi:MAG: T9SS type A sorting domain-containing protein [Vicingaceae bacterium]
MKNAILFSLILALSAFTWKKSEACINPDSVIIIVVNYDTITNAPFITNVEIRMTNLRLMNENNNKICSCALSEWATLFSNVDYIAFVDSGTNNPYAGFAAWNETAAASSAWNSSLPGYSWGGRISDVINSGLSASDPVDLVIRASAPLGVQYTLIGDSTLGYNSLESEVKQGALGTDEWSATSNDLVQSHQGVKPFNSFLPGNSITFFVADSSYFTQLDKDILENIPVGIDDCVGCAINYSVSAYPNPFSNNLDIRLIMDEQSDMLIELLDVTGRVISSQTKIGMAKGSHVIDIQSANELVSGMYFIRLNDGNEQEVLKVMKN